MNSNYNNISVLEDEAHLEIRIGVNAVSNVSDQDVFFAKERYKLHQTTPKEGVEIDILKKYFSKKYGF